MASFRNTTPMGHTNHHTTGCSLLSGKKIRVFARYATATSTMGLASTLVPSGKITLQVAAQKPWFLVARSAHRPLSCPLSSNPPRQAGKSSPAVVRLHDHAKTASCRTQAGREQPSLISMEGNGSLVQQSHIQLGSNRHACRTNPIHFPTLPVPRTHTIQVPQFQ